MSTNIPAGLDGAEVYVRADHPDGWGRWHIRADDTVVYETPSGEWTDPAMVAAETLRRSGVWARKMDP